MLRQRVLIADDHAASTDRIKAILPPQFEVVATVCSDDPQALSRTALKLKPGIVLIDVAMAIRDGFQAVKEIVQHLPRTRIVFYPNEDECRSDAAETSSGVASALGACGFVTKGVADCGSLDATHVALKPDSHGASAIGSASFHVLQAHSTPSPQELTGREYEVLALLAAGHPMKRIAYRLGITYRTVTFHKYRMMERLGIKTNAGLMTYALRRNVAEHMGQKEFPAAA
jgi:DNA-binding NarL/FixJ family response regulator